MNNTNITPEQREELLAHAKLADLVTTTDIEEFSKLATEADGLFAEFRRARMNARWLAAIRTHGSHENALQVEKQRRDYALSQVNQMSAATSDIRKARDAMTYGVGGNKLNDVFTQIKDADSEASDLRVIANNMRSTRNAKVAALIEDDIPEETALSVAKPSLADIAAKLDEAKAIPEKVSALRAVVSSYEAKVNYLYPLPAIE